jgi:hypothetical protein
MWLHQLCGAIVVVTLAALVCAAVASLLSLTAAMVVGLVSHRRDETYQVISPVQPTLAHPAIDEMEQVALEAVMQFWAEADQAVQLYQAVDDEYARTRHQ